MKHDVMCPECGCDDWHIQKGGWLVCRHCGDSILDPERPTATSPYSGVKAPAQTWRGKMSSRNTDRIDKIETAAWVLLCYWDGLSASDKRASPRVSEIVERTRKALLLPKHVHP